MAKNPETVITNELRKRIEDRGGYFMKISDQFSRGIPDAFASVVIGLVAIEVKVDRSAGTKDVRTYKSLGLSGAQDHRLRRILACSNSMGSAFVFTNTTDGTRPTLWVPKRPDLEGRGFDEYMVFAEGWDEIMRDLGYV